MNLYTVEYLEIVSSNHCNSIIVEQVAEWLRRLTRNLGVVSRSAGHV